MHDFYLDARRRADAAHLLVVNHALLMADISTGGRILPLYSHLVVDEAHQLEAAATDQMTFRVDWPAVQALLARLTLSGDLLASLRQAADAGQESSYLRVATKLAARVRQTAAELEQFATSLMNFAAGHSSIRADVDYAQRLSIDAGLRAQPMWSEIEIEWDAAGNRLRTVTRLLSELIGELERAGWRRRETQTSVLGELQNVADQLAELTAQLELILDQNSASDRRHNAVTWMEVSDGGKKRSNRGAVSLFSAPLHIGAVVERALVHERRSVVFTGATLRTGSGFSYIRERLGLWDVTASTVESPFNFRQSTLLLMPTTLAAPNQPHYQQAVEEAIFTAAKVARGRTLALFTSYAQLRTTSDAIRGQLDRLGITVLQHGTSSRHRLLREFRRTEQAVLLGTRSFWEGIDLPGEQLSVLVIVRLPFAVPSDPLVAARSAEFENAFTNYTLPDAILRFRQGFGRLIRRTTDRGVVILLDSRVWQKRYGQAFLEALPECTTRHAPLSDLGTEIDLWLNQASETDQRNASW